MYLLKIWVPISLSKKKVYEYLSYRTYVQSTCLSRSLGGFGTADGIRKGSTRRELGQQSKAGFEGIYTWGSSACGKDGIGRPHLGHNTAGRKKGSKALPSRRSLGENGTAADRDARAAVGLLPRCRRQREWCTYTPAPVKVVRPDLWPAMSWERVWPPMSCLDLESMREWTRGTLVKQTLRLLLLYIVEWFCCTGFK